MRENITLNQEEQKRLCVLNQVIEGKLVARKAAELLQRSVRQIRRWIAGYRRRGAVALIHGNRGRPPVNRVPKSTLNRVVKLARGPYSGFNQQHFTEMLAEREGIHLSRSSVRRILGKSGIVSPRRRRPAKHRSRRERYPQEGMLVQIDGSPHRWFGSKGPEGTLLAAIDDATGKVLGAVFRQHEDAQGYFLLIRMIVEKYGCPLAVYRDRHGIFQRGKNRNRTIAEELEDQPNYTQFGRLLKELGIESIPSHSPQAKGRIERLFGTFQDRLVNELRLAGIGELRPANAMLSGFLPRYNRRFAVPPQQNGAMYRQPPPGIDLNTMFAFKYLRTVGMDNTLRFRQHRIQIEPDRHRISYARARVEVHERMDGSLAVYYRGRCLATTDAPAEAPVLRVQHAHRPSSSASDPMTADRPTRVHAKKPAHRWKPPQDHPWRRLRLRSWPKKPTPFSDLS
jgi:transposase